MNFKEERKKRKWTLANVAEKTGYSVAAVNGIELRDEGGYELRDVLSKLYGAKLQYGEHQPSVLAMHDAPNLIDEAIAEVQQMQKQLSALEKKLNRIKYP